MKQPTVTTTSLSRLTPRERQVYWRLLAPGTTETVEDIADAFDIDVKAALAYAYKTRRKLPGLRGVEFRRRGLAVVALDIVPGRFAGLEDDDSETLDQGAVRARRELAGGLRCRRCHLLLPCDHEHRRAA